MNSGDDQHANLQVAAEAVSTAAGQGAHLVVLPENFAAMGAKDAERRKRSEADGHGPVQDALSTMAERAGVWLVGGTIPIRLDDDPRPVAACCVYDPAGRRVARYDKIHLFDVNVPGAGERYRESANTAPGRSAATVETPWGRLGLAVCYDLRFPELFRKLVADGADLFVVPAAFTHATGSAHWEVLLRARAIENLCYVVAAAQTGHHPGGRRTWGHSMVIGPWGEVLADGGDRPGPVLAAVDPARPHRLRAEFPVLTHRVAGL
ncbi:MAG TPA: carbon-nitrogen hydrolase family protein [Chromatiales bacterium]|nr:carbon-nitrogen hydrolase family protein [Chromatiales bacterium]